MKHAHESSPAEQNPREEEGSKPVYTPGIDQIVTKLISNFFSHIRADPVCADHLIDLLHPALMNAAAEGDKDSALLLIGEGAETEGVVAHALEHHHPDVAILLLQHGAYPHAYPECGYVSPLYVAAQHGWVKVLRVLVDFGAEINFANDDTDGTALFAASAGGHYPAVHFLLEEGADPCIRSVHDESPLDKAAKQGDEKVVEALLSNGAPVDGVGADTGYSPIHFAGTGRVVDLLVEAGADIEARANDGVTPLLRAFSRLPALDAPRLPAPEAVRALVRHGADIKVQDHDGDSVLHYAVRLSEETELEFRQLAPDLVDFLLKSGADETLVNNDGKTAADKARSFGRGPRKEPDCVLQLLDNAPADRVWRRRGLLVLCVARHPSGRPFRAKSLNTLGTDSTSISDSAVKERADDWNNAADWLLDLSREKAGIFRKIVGYL